MDHIFRWLELKFITEIEKRSDLLISTLRSYVEAVSGRLSLVASFRTRSPWSCQASERFLEIKRTNNPRRLKYMAFVLLLGLTGDFFAQLKSSYGGHGYDREHSRNHQKGRAGLCRPRGDWIKADVGALGVKVDELGSKFESKFDALHAEFDALRSEARANQRAWR